MGMRCERHSMHLGFSPPTWRSLCPWVWPSVPPAQALTWAWGCWFLGEAGRLWGSPSISIQYLFVPVCRDMVPKGGARERLVPHSEIRPLLPLTTDCT